MWDSNLPELRFEEKSKASVLSLPETPFHPHFAPSVSPLGQLVFTKHLLCASVLGRFPVRLAMLFFLVL